MNFHLDEMIWPLILINICDILFPGELHRHIVQLQVSEGTAVKKLEDSLKKITKLQAQLLRYSSHLLPLECLVNIESLLSPLIEAETVLATSHWLSDDIRVKKWHVPFRGS